MPFLMPDMPSTATRMKKKRVKKLPNRTKKTPSATVVALPLAMSAAAAPKKPRAKKQSKAVNASHVSAGGRPAPCHNRRSSRASTGSYVGGTMAVRLARSAGVVDHRDSACVASPAVSSWCIVSVRNARGSCCSQSTAAAGRADGGAATRRRPAPRRTGSSPSSPPRNGQIGFTQRSLDTIARGLQMLHTPPVPLTGIEERSMRIQMKNMPRMVNIGESTSTRMLAVSAMRPAAPTRNTVPRSSGSYLHANSKPTGALTSTLHSSTISPPYSTQLSAASNVAPVTCPPAAVV
mmetsp:Transcript_23115/g.80560  ORF Transcript_23115/g.80560 Transcript_23115/m.80560 type:complete len:292 (+) Transcript_23115:647-1522(+)